MVGILACEIWRFVHSGARGVGKNSTIAPFESASTPISPCPAAPISNTNNTVARQVCAVLPAPWPGAQTRF